jgi:hypothetical protein
MKGLLEKKLTGDNMNSRVRGAITAWTKTGGGIPQQFLLRSTGRSVDRIHSELLH